LLYLAAVDLFRHLLPQHSAQRARHPGEEVRPIQARITRAGGDVIAECFPPKRRTRTSALSRRWKANRPIPT
jgi:hypothetical protein